MNDTSRIDGLIATSLDDLSKSHLAHAVDLLKLSTPAATGHGFHFDCPNRLVMSKFRIVDEAPLDPIDRVALATALFLGDLSDLYIHASCFDPRHALLLNGFEVAICVECGGIVRWSVTGKSQGGIGPIGGPIWDWVRRRHGLRPPEH